MPSRGRELGAAEKIEVGGDGERGSKDSGVARKLT